MEQNSSDSWNPLQKKQKLLIIAIITLQIIKLQWKFNQTQ